MNNPSDSLIALVTAKNRANAEANRLQPLAIEAIRPFFGKKILKADGCLLAKVEEAMKPALQVVAPIRVWRDSSRYSLNYVIRTYESSISAESYFTLGELDNHSGNLVKLAEPTTHKTDYNAEEIAQLRLEAEKAKEIARKAENACHPFGLFDR